MSIQVRRSGSDCQSRIYYTPRLPSFSDTLPVVLKEGQGQKPKSEAEAEKMVVVAAVVAKIGQVIRLVRHTHAEFGAIPRPVRALPELSVSKSLGDSQICQLRLVSEVLGY